MQAHSLLTRDVDNQFKFSHKSFLEYFWVLNILADKNFADNFRFTGQSDCIQFYEEKIEAEHFLPILKNDFHLIDGTQYPSERKHECESTYFSVNTDIFCPIGSKDKALLSEFSIQRLKEATELRLISPKFVDLKFLGFFKKIQTLDISQTRINTLSYIFPCFFHANLKEIIVSSDFPNQEIKAFKQRNPQVNVHVLSKKA